MKYSEIMIDLETLDILPTSVILSIGACKFTWQGEIIDKFYVNVDATDCKQYGLTVSADTVKWWMEQPKSIRDAVLVDPIPLKDALTKLNDWVGSDKHSWWCNGMNFDFPILEYAYKKTGLVKPWIYRNLNDYRTVLNLFDVRNDLLRKKNEAETYHNALGDSIWQAKTLAQLIGEHKLNG